MKGNEHTLKELLQHFAGQKNVKEKLLNKKLEDAWNALYPQLMTYTSKIQYKEGLLTVRLTSATLRQELSYHKLKMIDKLNESLGEQLINAIELK